MAAFEIFKDFSDDGYAANTLPLETNRSPGMKTKLKHHRGHAINQKRVACGDLPLQPRPKFPLAPISRNIVLEQFLPPTVTVTTASTNVNCLFVTGGPTKLPTPPVAQFEAFKMYEDKENNPKQSHATGVSLKSDSDAAKAIISHSRLATDTHSSAFSSKKCYASTTTVTTAAALAIAPIRQHVQQPHTRIQSTHTVHDFQKEQQENQNNFLEIKKSERNLFFEVIEYQSAIYEYLRDAETRNRPNAQYIQHQPDVTENMRSVLIDWLVEVAEEYRLQTETLYLTVSYIDRFLSLMTVVKTKLQLLGTTAMFIAAKYEEIYPPEISEFVYITDDTYTKKQMLKMEYMIVKVLAFDLSVPPTPLSFITQFSILNQINERTTHFAMFLCELSILNSENYLQYLPSVLAASSILLARYHLSDNRHETNNCDAKQNYPRLPDDETDDENTLSLIEYYKRKHPLIEITTINNNNNDNHHINNNNKANSKSGSSRCKSTSAGDTEIWPKSLEAHTKYTVRDLYECVSYIQSMYIESHSMTLKAIKEKYRKPKYSSVTEIVPKSETIELADLES